MILGVVEDDEQHIAGAQKVLADLAEIGGLTAADGLLTGH